MSKRDRSVGDPYESGHGSPRIHVEHYDLDLAYDVRTNRLAGTATLRICAREALAKVPLDLVGLTVEKVRVSGAGLAKARHRDGRLAITLTRKVPAATLFTVVVRYAGHPAPVVTRWGPVGWEELDDGVLVASQPTGAPSWFPCNDRPADKATYRTSVTVDDAYHVLAHGALRERRSAAGSTTWVYEESQPTSTYLATVQVGRYEEVLLVAGPVPQRAVLPAALAPAARRLLARHGEMMALFTRVFGPYPFNGYTVVVTPDALEIPVEAQGLSVFGANHLAPKNGEERLVPHELAHQWFGNSVSVASWQHIWLNEGFACYAEWLWSEASGGPSADALAAQWRGRLARLPQDLVLADPGPERIFDDRVYKRGALCVHALRRTVGEDAFGTLLRAWTARHRYGTVTTGDFRAHAVEQARASGGKALARAVAALLSAWLDSGELPRLPTR